ncbi:unnamed protein product [Taenia asiatica]|uniref:SCP domain-containing protein n=1 Tax=Taenia asiatica TaxID=60517 RepID=A0A0R3W5D9_TAEAS|nr:unnamed protein product [Taenia asiatica]
MAFLTLFFAFLTYAYANNVTTVEALVPLMAIHASIRDNFTILGKKLTPLKCCKDLERLAEQWVNTCTQSRPTNPRFFSLGSNVMAAPVHKRRDIMPRERRNYNPATGEYTAAPCEHLRQIVQPNDTHFDCAVRGYVLWPPIKLSVCLYGSEGHGVPIQHEVAASNTTTTTASTTMVRSATVMVMSGNRTEPPSLESTISFVAERTVKYLMDHFVEGKEEDEEDEEEEDEEEDEEIEEKVFDSITSLESTISTVKSIGSLASPLLDIDKMEEADEEEEEEEEEEDDDDDDETKEASKSTQLSPLFPSFAVIVIALLF